MKYPVGYWRQLARETVCFFFGHAWDSSWQRRPDYDELQRQPYDLLPYAQRQSGNPYYHFAAWWHYKCRRCRLKTRNDAWYPWHVKLRWALTGAWRTGKVHLEIIDELHTDPRARALLLCSIPFAMLNQALLYGDHLPSSWWTPLADFEDWTFRKADEWDRVV